MSLSRFDASSPARPSERTHLVARLTDPALAAALSRYARARLAESDAEDVVQATLSDALQSTTAPEEDEEIVRWVYGICRHKIVDWFRRMRREVPRDLEADDSAPAESAPTGAMDLMRWARKELPEGKENEQTFEWMLREGAGEKLESIAAEENLPAPRVRQRVSRLRRYYKARWAAQTAAVAALLMVGLAIYLALRGKPEEIAPRPDPSFEPSSLPLPPPPAPLAPSPLVPAASSSAPDAAPPAPSAAPAPMPTPPPTLAPPPTFAPNPTSAPSDSSKPPSPTKGKASPKPTGLKGTSLPSQHASDSLGSSSLTPAPAPASSDAKLDSK